MVKALSGKDVVSLLEAASEGLNKYREEIDALNVFPVPDGDTGTNMALTMERVMAEIRQSGGVDLQAIKEAAVTGALMGARGNSGVILSQILKGFFEKISSQEINSKSLIEAMENSVKIAYQAVRKPVEGTILTVLRQGAGGADRETDDISVILQTFVDAATKSLKETPEMLPVLKEAQVVDAAGFGLVVMAEEALQQLERRTGRFEELEKLIKEPLLKEEEEINFTYCTEFLYRSLEFKKTQIEKKISGMGDSVLVVGEQPLFRVHIHTDSPGEVITSLLKKGGIHEVKINNMREQFESRRPEGEDGVGVLAVAPGDGIAKILTSLGVGRIISGGQTMNPSTEEILKVSNGMREKEIIVLPSNKNIILSAINAAALSKKKLITVPTRSVPQTIAAAMAYMPGKTIEETESEMESAAAKIKTLEVAQAVRDSKMKGLNIKKGEYLGMVEGEIVTARKNVVDSFKIILKRAIEPENTFISIYYAKDFDKSLQDKIEEFIRNKYREIELECRPGGQSIYEIIAGLE